MDPFAEFNDKTQLKHNPRSKRQNYTKIIINRRMHNKYKMQRCNRMQTRIIIKKKDIQS